MSTNDTSLGKIVESVQKPELSLNEIEMLATEVLGQRSKEAASLLFDMLVHQPAENLTTNLLALFGELSVRSPEWVRILNKSIAKKGRCPKPLVPRIKQILTTEPGKLAERVGSIRDLLADLERVIDEPIIEQRDRRVVAGVKIERKTQWFRSGKIRATIPMSTELSDIRHMEALSSLLGDITSKPDELRFDFSGVEHIYVIGLVALKAWCNNI
ncbi:MAG: hypothetical protein JW959_02065 [Pirellulales bacterium]|nr:hypothetical protein [Pirellulales bacterium]